MKLGLFWLDKLSWEVELAIQSLIKVSSDAPFEHLILFTDRLQLNTVLFVRKTTQYPYDTINDLQDVFSHARDRDLDFALISFGNGIPISLTRLATLLVSEPIQKSIWSFRICQITGAGFRHPSRLPLVDDHFIVLNVRRAADTGFFDRKLIHASHFCQAGGRHSHLSSMIEYALNDGEFYNHFVPDASRDQYGKMCRFDPMPFHLCESTGFLTCYGDFKPALHELLRRNLDGQYFEPAAWLDRLRYFRRGEFWYFRSVLGLDKSFSAVKRRFSIDKFDFRKRDEGEI